MYRRYCNGVALAEMPSEFRHEIQPDGTLLPLLENYRESRGDADRNAIVLWLIPKGDEVGATADQNDGDHR
jgi:hypothetical protein